MSDRDYAIVIGVGRFEGLPPLESPWYDAEDVEAWLRDTAGLEQKRIRCIRSEDDGAFTPIKSQIDKTFESVLNEVAPVGGRRLYVYYSGHGSNMPYEHILLEMADSSETIPVGLNGELYAAKLRGWPGFREQLFIFDCCRTDGRARGLAEPGFEVPPCPLPRGEGGQIVWYGAKASQRAYERPVEPGGPARSFYTRALLEGLGGRAAVPDDDGTWTITTDSLHAYAGHRVAQLVEDTPGVSPQTPTFAQHAARSFVLATGIEPDTIEVSVTAPAGTTVVAEDAAGREHDRAVAEEGVATLHVVPGAYRFSGPATGRQVAKLVGFGEHEADLSAPAPAAVELL